jgi:hypothetical protein
MRWVENDFKSSRLAQLLDCQQTGSNPSRQLASHRFSWRNIAIALKTPATGVKKCKRLIVTHCDLARLRQHVSNKRNVLESQAIIEHPVLQAPRPIGTGHERRGQRHRAGEGRRA